MRVDTKVLVGTPFVEIIREVMRDWRDLLIKPATGQCRRKTIRLASTDMHLIRECPRPVRTTKPTTEKKYARILAVVNPDPGDEERNKLNAEIVELSMSLAESERSELHIVHAWILYEKALLRLLIGTVEPLVRETRTAHKERLDELLQNYSLAKDRCHVHLLEGKAKDVIPMVAEQESAHWLKPGCRGNSSAVPRRMCSIAWTAPCWPSSRRALPPP